MRGTQPEENVVRMKKRIEQLDGVRALAVGAVFLNHAFHAKLLWAGVDLFFILSGFLITGILIGEKDKSLRGYFAHFYERRARRILPPYALLLAITSIVFGLAWLRHWYLYIFLMNVLVGYSIHMPHSLQVLWSLAVEEQFYLVWPFVVYFLGEKSLAWVTAALLLAAPVLRGVCTPLFAQHWQIYSLTPFRMDLLAMGGLLALVWRRKRVAIERWGIYGLGLTVAAIAAMGLLSRNPHFNTDANTRTTNVWIYELTLLASTGVILWALSGRAVAPLTWKPVRYIGRISYSIYLIHLTAILVMARYLHGTAAAAAAAAAVTLAYAGASWHFVEKPILFWKGRVRREAQQDVDAITDPAPALERH